MVDWIGVLEQVLDDCVVEDVDGFVCVFFLVGENVVVGEWLWLYVEIGVCGVID